MRNIVTEFIENPRPHLRKQLTTMELKYAKKQIELRKSESEPVVEKSSKSKHK